MSISIELLPQITILPRRGLEVTEILAAVGASELAFLWESSAAQKPNSASTPSMPGRYSYLGLHPTKLLTVRSDEVVIRTRNRIVKRPLSEYGANPLLVVEQELEYSYGSPKAFHQLRNSIAHCPPFCGGAVGFVAYDTVRYLERIPSMSGHDNEPDLFFHVVGDCVVIDRARDEIHLISWPDVSSSRPLMRQVYHERQREAQERHTALILIIERLQARDQNQKESEVTQQRETQPYRAQRSREEFVAEVNRALEYIRAGDIYQVILSNRLTLEAIPDPLRVYRCLLDHNPSPYHFLLRFEGRTLVGASPEVFLRSSATQPRRVFTRPVAGTYPREQRGGQTVQALSSDIKERAEHIMLVDLARNDLGRVSRVGTVKVSDLLSVETYAHVHHLVSQVEGELKEGESIWKAFAASFPIGTLAGTPKIRAMEIIAEMERAPRGIFGGAVVMASPDRHIDSGVAIRYVVIDENGTSLQVGAGIVHDSIPEREYEECLWKAQSLLQAISVGVS